MKKNMKCRECIGYGRDHISPCCVAGFSHVPTNGIEIFKDGSYGCRMRKEKIEKLTKLAMEEHPKKFILFNGNF